MIQSTSLEEILDILELLSFPLPHGWLDHSSKYDLRVHHDSVNVVLIVSHILLKAPKTG